MEKHTFCIGSTTVARLLERKVGKTLPTFFFANIDRVRALDEQVLNITEISCAASTCPLLPPSFNFLMSRQIPAGCLQRVVTWT